MRILPWTIVLIAMMVFMELLGIGTAFGDILGVIGIGINADGTISNADTIGSVLYQELLSASGILTLAAIAGVLFVGFFTKTFSTELITLPVITLIFAKFVTTGFMLVSYAQTLGEPWIVPIVALIFLPLSAGYVIACVEWFRGMK